MNLLQRIKARVAPRLRLAASRTEPRAAEGVESPYLAARRTWNDHVARIVAARLAWQMVALGSVMVALAAVAGVVHLGSRSQFIPYVVAVDQAGNVAAVDRADRLVPPSRVVIEAQLQKFFTLSRRVTTDVALQRSSIFSVYAMLDPKDPATAKMTDYLNGTPEASPFVRAKEVTVTAEVTSVLPQSGDSWQVDWIESVYDRDGHRKARFAMQALAQVYPSEPKHTTEEALKQNPLGIYVRDFSWNRNERREVAP